MMSNVATTRKALAEVRRVGLGATRDAPLFISSVLASGVPMDRFCHGFMLDQHMKRHAKSSSQKLVTESRAGSESEKAPDHDSCMVTVVGPRMKTLYLRTQT